MGRTIRRLVIILYDPKRYMNTVKLLRARGIQYNVPDSPNFKVLTNDVIYTDSIDVFRKFKDKVAKVFYDPRGTRYVLEKAILALKDKKVYNLLSIGIDPGGKYTVIALADGELIDWNHISDIDSLRKYVSDLLASIPAREKVVRVGIGGRGLEIAYTIRKAVEKRVIIEAVDEVGSTPHGYRNPFIERILSNIGNSIDNSITRKRDLYAAIIIALKEGFPVDIYVEDRTEQE